MSELLFLRGIDDFNHGRFFEAHEVWEELWNDTVGDEKRFYQGLIHIAVGYYKLSVAEYNGARKLLERGRQIVVAFPAGYAGIDLAPLLATVATTVHDLVAGQVNPDVYTPAIRLRE